MKEINKVQSQSIEKLDDLYLSVSKNPSEENLSLLFKAFDRLKSIKTDFNLLLNDDILYYTFDLYDIEGESFHIKTYQLEKHLELEY